MRKDAVYLNIQTWIGTAAFGAEHYYGRLSYYKGDDYKTCDVTIVIDKEHAARLNENEDKGSPRYRVGYTTIRMFSEEQVIEAAKLMWKNDAPDARLLIMGSNSTVEPQLILAHTSDVDIEKVNRINELTKLREPLRWRRDNKELNAICDEWKEIFFNI